MNVSVDIPEQRIVDALVSACENASGYWARTEWYPYDRQGKRLELDKALVVTDIQAEPTEKRHYLLTRHSLRKGLALMAGLHPHHFADLLGGGDRITGDVLLQLSTIGEVKYG